MLGLGLAALPQKLLAEAVGLLIEIALVAGIAYHYTAKHYELKEAADLAKAQAAAAAQYQALTNKYNDAASALESAKANHEVVFSTITKEVPTIIHDPVYLNNCLDAAGMRLINNSLAGKISTPASIASSALLAASAP